MVLDGNELEGVMAKSCLRRWERSQDGVEASCSQYFMQADMVSFMIPASQTCLVAPPPEAKGRNQAQESEVPCF